VPRLCRSALDSERVVLTHVEEMDGLSHDDLLRLAKRLGRNVVFAYDTMLIDV
jgi:phosphoribosyl 1,2-cyclic phosphate phosphodiesterase